MFIIVDNFYKDPDSIREYALSLPYNVYGNYPGVRSLPAKDSSWRNSIKVYLENNILHKKITYFPEEKYNTSFQYTMSNAVTWVHHDETVWAGIVYLTPNAPVESGTAIYRHKKTKIFAHEQGLLDYNGISTEYKDWEIISFAGNVYNRLVLYLGKYYHRSVVPGFGCDLHTARLFQTFFFDTEI